MDGLKEREGYLKLTAEALDHTVWTARYGRGYVPVAKETEWKSLLVGGARTEKKMIKATGLMELILWNYF